jgi:AcrR family transcriptional regulator
VSGVTTATSSGPVTDERPSGAAAPRPLRADAQRNYDNLLRAARETLTAQEDTSLDAIAKRAGVGIGTLYRHFPNRLALLEAVYRADVDRLSGLAVDVVATMDAWQAVETWFDAFSGYAATKRLLFQEIIDMAGREAEVLSHSRLVIMSASEDVIGNAQRAGVVRTDIEASDVTRLVGGCTMMPGSDPGQQARMLRLVLDGIRA